jgi:putative ABC transport system permease protein
MSPRGRHSSSRSLRISRRELDIETAAVCDILGVFAAIAAALAAIGIGGVIAYAVAQRRREIGIRIALGAGHWQVVGLMLRHSLLLTAAGMLIGITGAVALKRYLEGMLFDLAPLDPPTWIGVLVLFAVVATAAAYLPARRATKIDLVRAGISFRGPDVEAEAV